MLSFKGHFDALLQQKFVIGAGLFRSSDGSKLVESGKFSLDDDETTRLLKLLEDPEVGVSFEMANNDRYMMMESVANLSMKLKKQHNYIIVRKTDQTVIIGICDTDATETPIDLSEKRIEELLDDLRKSHY